MANEASIPSNDSQMVETVKDGLKVEEIRLSTLAWLAAVLGKKETLILRQREKLGSSHLNNGSDLIMREGEQDVVDMFVNYLKKDGLTDEDLAGFRAFKALEKMNEMSEEERKKCLECANRVEALMTTWDGLRRGALDEFEKKRKEGIVLELDRVVESVDSYFLDNSIVIEVVRVVTDLENQIRRLKEENAWLSKERDEIKAEWTEKLDIQIEKRLVNLENQMHGSYLENVHELEVAMKRKLDGLRLQLEGFGMENSCFRKMLRKNFGEASSLLKDYWLRIFEMEKLLALKRNDVVECGLLVSSIMREVESRKEQNFQLQHAVEKKKLEVLKQEKEWVDKVIEIEKMLVKAAKLWEFLASS